MRSGERAMIIKGFFQANGSQTRFKNIPATRSGCSLAVQVALIWMGSRSPRRQASISAPKASPRLFNDRSQEGVPELAEQKYGMEEILASPTTEQPQHKASPLAMEILHAGRAKQNLRFL